MSHDKSARKVLVGLTGSEFEKIVDSLSDPALAQNFRDAFAAASSELDRKQARNFLVRYFDLLKDFAIAPVQGHHAKITLVQR